MIMIGLLAPGVAFSDGRNGKATRTCTPAELADIKANLLRLGANSETVDAAAPWAEKLFECADSEVVLEKTLRDARTGETYQSVIFRFPGHKVRVTYLRGKFNGAAALPD